MTSYTKIYDWLYDVPELRLADIVIFSKIMRRLDLSKHNKKHFTDDRGVYCVYSLEDMAEAGKCSIGTAQASKNRLIAAGLITARKVGYGTTANRIYLGDAVPMDFEDDTKKKKEPLSGEIREVIDLWNTVASKAGLLEHTGDKKTEKRIKRLIAEHGLDTVKSVIQSVGENDFLTGRSKNASGWKVDLQWLSNTESFRNVLRGKYGKTATLQEEERKRNDAELMAKLIEEDRKNAERRKQEAERQARQVQEVKTYWDETAAKRDEVHTSDVLSIWRFPVDKLICERIEQDGLNGVKRVIDAIANVPVIIRDYEYIDEVFKDTYEEIKRHCD